MTEEIWGQDLKIVDWNLGKDLSGSTGFHPDYLLTSGADNLAQAVTLRLLSHRGSHAHLGHPSYGSRLYELVGELNNRTNRKLAEMHAREALERESRIESILQVRAEENPSKRNVIDIHLSLKIIQETVPLNLVVPFSLEGE